MLIISECMRDIAQCGGLSIALAWVSDAAIGQHIVERQDAADSEQALGLVQDRRVFSFVAVHENNVVSLIGEAGQDLKGATGDQPGAHMVVAQGSEGFAGHPLVFSVNIDRGQDTGVGHASEQGRTRDTGPGADLGYRLGADRGREEAQHRSG